jgi:phosphoribosylanthranilate isomerase
MKAMRTRVKICGITREQDARAAAAAGADAIGFVFWPNSPRRIDPREAAGIGRALPALLTRVGVFVNASPRDVSRAVIEAKLDAVQLHGEEDPEAYMSCGAAVIKVVSLVSDVDVARARSYSPSVTLLVDAKDVERRGGTGVRANWHFAQRLARIRPILLAGGLRASNVAEAVRTVHPWGVDVSSGVEIRPGQKSARQIDALLARVAEADRVAGARRRKEVR